jgi:purine-binding chemotaxis protein CheW
VSTAVDWDAVRARLDEIGRALRSESSEGDARALLESRARALARRPAEPERGDELRLVTFELSGETYAVEARWVAEVARLERPTPLPGAELPLFALVAWRGELLPLIDLRALLGLSSTGDAAPAWMVVLGDGRPEVGVPIDEPGEFHVLRAGEVTPSPTPRPGVRGLTADAVVVLDGAAVLGAW